MIKKNTKRNDILNKECKNFNKCGGDVITFDNTNNATHLSEEKAINLKYDDFKAQNLLDLGFNINPMFSLNDEGRIMIKQRIESIAKNFMDKVNNSKTDIKTE